MTCIRCDHAVPVGWPDQRNTYYLYGNGYTEKDRRNVIIKCTLNPIWIDVKGGHFCSHDTSTLNAAAHNNRMLTTEGAWKDAADQRDRAISAEKKLKALRKKMRESK